MKSIQLKFVAFLVILVATVACSTDKHENYCFRSVTTPIQSVSGSETTAVNTPITFNVTFTPLDSCGKFRQFVETPGFPKEIKILADHEGCNCLPTEEAVTLPYSFTATTAGEYVLKFVTDNPNTPIIKTITVTK